MPKDFLAIVGPTASGKTSLSLAVAPRLDAEIVSMDSRQVYRGMDIGTAKVEAAGQASVPHHGLDRVRPDESYGAGRFAREARGWIGDIRARGRVPLLVGGTGFFLRALTDPIFREPPLDGERRRAIRRWLSRQSDDRLAAWVQALDPERAGVAVAGGPQRLGRALEVALLTGRPLSEWHRSGEPEAHALAGPVILLELPRAEMDRRIDARVDRMLEGGLVEEVQGLLDAGFTAADPGMSATGYREVVGYLQGEWTLEQAADEIRRATRRYARRQLTWFRHQLPGARVAIDATAPIEAQVSQVLAVWESAPEREDEGG
jgi:tRNA dimethylallyltransferase